MLNFPQFVLILGNDRADWEADLVLQACLLDT